jgi:hypothetical protein
MFRSKQNQLDCIKKYVHRQNTQTSLENLTGDLIGDLVANKMLM